MKSILIVICFLVITPKPSFAQLTERDSIEYEFDQFLDTLNLDSMSSNTLLNRGFFVSQLFEEWSSSSALIFDNLQWDLLSYCYNRIDTVDTIPHRSIIEGYNTLQNSGSGVNTYALPLIYLKGEYYRDTILSQYRSGASSLTFEPFNLLAVSPTSQFSSQGEVKFRIHPDLIFSNTPISSLFIDFDDGLGFLEHDFSLEKIINVQYPSPGEKNLIFQVVDSTGDTTVSYCMFQIGVVESFLQGGQYAEYLDSTDTLVAVRATSTYNNGISYYYHLGDDQKLNKPVIIIEGFDVTNTKGTNEIAVDFQHYLPKLKAAGFDIFIVNFKDARINLHSNKAQLKGFIKSIYNSTSAAGNFVENHEGIVMAVSMGGIIARMALKELENEGFDHRIRTLITMDTPHKGANVSLCLQKAVIDLINTLPPGLLLNTIVPLEMTKLVFLNGKALGVTIWTIKNAIQSGAAKQMVVMHYQGNQGYLDLQNDLNQLGWPTNCRNVALSCGSNRAISQNLTAGTQMFYTDFKLTPISKRYIFWGKYIPTNSSNYKYWEIRRYNFLGHLQVKKEGIYSSTDDKPWETAPAGRLFKDVTIKNATLVPAAMVPCVSSFDLKNNFFNGSNFTIYNRDIGQGKSYLFSTNKVNVDEIYSLTNSFNGSTTYNVQHPFVFEEPIMVDIILDQEIMTKNYFLQNRIFDKDVDIECSNNIIVGRDVLPPDKYLYEDANYNQNGINLNSTETEKSQPTGDVLVKSGEFLNLEAKSSIKIKSGFKAISGSHLTLKVDGTNPNTRSSASKGYCGRIIQEDNINEGKRVYKLSSLSQEAIWELRGHNVQLYETGSQLVIPDNLKKGQYSLNVTSQGCPVASIVFSVSKLDQSIQNPPKNFVTENESSVRVFPNPSKGRFEIATKQTISKVTIIDPAGSIVSSIYPENNPSKIRINLDKYSAGNYIVKIETIEDEIYFARIIHTP